MEANCSTQNLKRIFASQGDLWTSRPSRKLIQTTVTTLSQWVLGKTIRLKHADEKLGTNISIQRIGSMSDLSSFKTPDNQLSGKSSSDRLLVINYHGDLYRSGQGQHLGSGDVMFAQVKDDEVGIAVERVLNRHQTDSYQLANTPCNPFTHSFHK